jgi:hypothetical protein
MSGKLLGRVFDSAPSQFLKDGSDNIWDMQVHSESNAAKDDESESI